MRAFDRRLGKQTTTQRTPHWKESALNDNENRSQRKCSQFEWSLLTEGSNLRMKVKAVGRSLSTSRDEILKARNVNLPSIVAEHVTKPLHLSLSSHSSIGYHVNSTHP